VRDRGHLLVQVLASCLHGRLRLGEQGDRGVTFSQALA
jgi:hypothetical protein